MARRRGRPRKLCLDKYPEFFKVYIPDRSSQQLDIPNRLVGKNGIQMKPEMVFRDQSGKSWPVRVCFRKDGRVFFAKGWKDFWKDNCMGFDDKCIFEFAISRGRRACAEIKVKIIRARKGTQKN